MPRIDPLELLKCLHVLLRDDGGIKSDSEVQRLASLMTRFSKKLVSKCIYVQILKRSETRLLGLFLGAGGWRLIHMWLQDGIINKNWALVQELLELLLLCPVHVELLKTNNCPKLVKGLSRDESHEGVRLLAGKLVEQWLRIVKGESQTAVPQQTATTFELNQESATVDKFKIIDDSFQQDSVMGTLKQDHVLSHVTTSEDVRSNEESNLTSELNLIKECKDKTLSEVAQNEQALNVYKTDDSSAGTKVGNDSENISINKDKESINKESNKSKEKRDKDKHSSSSSSSHKSSPKSSSSKHSSRKGSGSTSSSGSGSSSHRNKSSSRDKDRDRKLNHKSSSSSSSSSKDKGRERERERDHKDRDKDKEKERDKDKEKNRQEEKDKATLDKLKPKTLDKIGKIPKRRTSDDKGSKTDAKKMSISIEVRKNEGNRPKTVKTFNSKFRSHGLEEEAKPPPPRPVKKSSTSLPASLPPVKRPSPPPRYDSIIQPEKKAKLADAPVQTKPGAIKLIPAKPKPALLMESDMFMDALSASATNKKEPRKRKRKLSASKDVETDQPTTKSSSPPQSPKAEESDSDNKSSQNEDTVTVASANEAAAAVASPAPPRFYQDTLENTDEEKEGEKVAEKTEMTSDDIRTPEYTESEEADKEPKTVAEISTHARSEDTSALKGVLLYAKRKGPKKKVQWRTEADLVDIQYFELDETERVNVTKTFTDMKQMERVNEREAFQLARKLPNEDTMEERTTWMILIPVDDVTPINFGKNSREKDIQYARERTVPPAMYYHRMMIPESPAEPDPQICSITDPAVIPLDDVTGNPDTVNDFQNTPWPEPKGNAPPPSITAPVTPFPAVPPMMPFPHGPGMPFPIPPFPGGPVPPFPMHGPAPDSLPPMTPDMMMNGGMFPPRMDGPPVDNNMMPINGFGPPFGPQFNGPNGGGFPGGGGRGMRPMNNMGGGGPRCPPNTGWYRPPGSGPNGPGWQNGPRGKSWNNPRICRQFRKGYCNKGDNCSYLHPGINCPPL